jgi:hypothetical protein
MRIQRVLNVTIVLLVAGLGLLAIACENSSSSGSSKAWTKTFDTPLSKNDVAQFISADSLGNVYVAGHTFWGTPDEQLLIVKFGFTGNLLWSFQAEPSANCKMRPMDFSATPESGPITLGEYCCGDPSEPDSCRLGLVKTDAAGSFVWLSHFVGTNDFTQPAAMEIDDEQNIYVAYTKDSACTVTKFNANGYEVWTSQYAPQDEEGIVTESGCHGIVRDINGKIFAIGLATEIDDTSANVFEEIFDSLIVNFGPQGKINWALRNPAQESWDSPPYSMGIDKSGNLGWAKTTYEESEFGIVESEKVSPQGESLWTQQNDLDFAGPVAVDASGNLFVTGCTSSEFGDADIFTLMFDPDGTLVWENIFDGDGGDDFARSIVVDSGGSVSIGATSCEADATGSYLPMGCESYFWPNTKSIDCVADTGSMVILKYDTQGEVVQNRKFLTEGQANFAALAIDDDDPTEIYIAGTTDTSGSDDFVAVKFINETQSGSSDACGCAFDQGEAF